MSRSQGQPLSKEEIHRIVSLLESTDMSLVDIARRMDCTRSSVARINKDFQIRFYEGRRSCWRVATEQTLRTAS